jgi:NADH-quinone oxidoreductase subunit N
MFFQEPVADGPFVVSGARATNLAVVIGTAATLVLGVAPQPLLDLANTAAQSGFVR